MHISTCISGAAFTAVAVGELNAVVRPPGITRVRQTLVDVAFTPLADVARRTHALIASYAVHTFAVVEAFGLVGQRVAGRGAVIQVDLTMYA